MTQLDKQFTTTLQKSPNKSGWTVRLTERLDEVMRTA